MWIEINQENLEGLKPKFPWKVKDKYFDGISSGVSKIYFYEYSTKRLLLKFDCTGNHFLTNANKWRLMRSFIRDIPEKEGSSIVGDKFREVIQNYGLKSIITRDDCRMKTLIFERLQGFIVTSLGHNDFYEIRMKS